MVRRPTVHGEAQVAGDRESCFPASFRLSDPSRTMAQRTCM